MCGYLLTTRPRPRIVQKVRSSQLDAHFGGPPYGYTTLGQITDGFDTVRRIAKLGKADQTPKAVVLIDKIRVREQSPADTTTTTT